MPPRAFFLGTCPTVTTIGVGESQADQLIAAGMDVLTISRRIELASP